MLIIVTSSFETIFTERLCYKWSKKSFLFFCLIFDDRGCFISLRCCFYQCFICFCNSLLHILTMYLYSWSKGCHIVTFGNRWYMTFEVATVKGPKKPCLICDVVRHCLKWQLSFGYLLQLIKVLSYQIFYFFFKFIYNLTYLTSFLHITIKCCLLIFMTLISLVFNSWSGPKCW